jgi:hypothetical protein
MPQELGKITRRLGLVHKQYGTLDCAGKPKGSADDAKASANYNIRSCYDILRRERLRAHDRGFSLDSRCAGNYKQRLPEMTSNEYSNGCLNAPQYEEMRTNPRGYFYPWA